MNDYQNTHFSSQFERKNNFMIMGTDTFAIQSRMILYVLSDAESGIGEIGVHAYGESPLIKIQTTPAIAKTVMDAWIKDETEDNEASSGFRRRRRTVRRVTKKPVKKGAKK